MPRTKLTRRFDPRFGVSQNMLEAESRYVGRELENYLLCSINELKGMLAERQKRIADAEAELVQRLSRLPDRQRLALRCMLARDLLHIGLLYQSFLSTSDVAEATGARSSVPEEQTAATEPTHTAGPIDAGESIDAGEPIPIIPFRESLFEP
jgi:hypothetical protein